MRNRVGNCFVGTIILFTEGDEGQYLNGWSNLVVGIQLLYSRAKWDCTVRRGDSKTLIPKLNLLCRQKPTMGNVPNREQY